MLKWPRSDQWVLSISAGSQQTGNNWAEIEGITPQTKILKMVNLSLVDTGVKLNVNVCNLRRLYQICWTKWCIQTSNIWLMIWYACKWTNELIVIQITLYWCTGVSHKDVPHFDYTVMLLKSKVCIFGKKNNENITAIDNQIKMKTKLLALIRALVHLLIVEHL